MEYKTVGTNTCITSSAWYQGLQSFRQPNYTPSPSKLTVVESASSREGVQLKEQPHADSIHCVHPTAFHRNVHVYSEISEPVVVS
jgi:hypothetical protein